MNGEQPAVTARLTERLVKRFETMVILALVAMMGVLIVLATVALVWVVVTDVVSPPFILLGSDELLDLFGFFLLVLIGIELLETIKAYLREHVVHVEIVLEVALIAVARKVIVLDLNDYSPLTVLAIAALIVALAVGYYLERARREELGWRKEPAVERSGDQRVT